jgi:hypothetical protein
MSLKEEVEKYGSISAAARARGMARTTFRRWLRKETKTQVKPEADVGISEEELLLKYNPEHKILHAAQQIPEGRFISEQEFMKRLRIRGGYKHIVNKSKFDQYRGRASGGTVYWGEPSRIAAMKDDGVLSQ